MTFCVGSHVKLLYCIRDVFFCMKVIVSGRQMSGNCSPGTGDFDILLIN